MMTCDISRATRRVELRRLTSDRRAMQNWECGISASSESRIDHFVAELTCSILLLVSICASTNSMTPCSCSPSIASIKPS